VVSDGFSSPNSRALLYPLLRHDRLLRDAGISVRIFTDVAEPGLPDCDTLIVDSKCLRDGWGERRNETLALLASLRRRAGRLLFFDTTDSAGLIIGEALSEVDAYYKGQVLKDRAAYARPLYGRRSYTDFYHRQYGILDTHPEGLKPQVSDVALTDRIHVSWNAGLADYSLVGPWLAALYHRIPLRMLLRSPAGWGDPAARRDIDVACRMGISYPRATVRYQREQIREKLGRYLQTDKRGRIGFYREMKNSRVVISAFGLGEITLKDFEIFISGALMIKPAMDHLETWPDLYAPDLTMLACRWDLSDLQEQIDKALSMPDLARAVASAGQARYRTYVASSSAGETFSARVRHIVSGGDCMAGGGMRPA